MDSVHRICCAFVLVGNVVSSHVVWLYLCFTSGKRGDTATSLPQRPYVNLEQMVFAHPAERRGTSDIATLKADEVIFLCVCVSVCPVSWCRTECASEQSCF